MLTEKYNHYLLAKLKEAALIAQHAHENQFDKAGQPYFQHVETVSKIVLEIVQDWSNLSYDFTIKAAIVGLLHDVLEDSDLTTKDLFLHSVPIDCIFAIEIITKTKNEPYDIYIAKVKHNKLASVVKIADMTHNCDLSRLSEVTQNDLFRWEKYQKSISYLSQFYCVNCKKQFPLSKMSESPISSYILICEDCFKIYKTNLIKYFQR